MVRDIMFECSEEGLEYMVCLSLFWRLGTKCWKRDWMTVFVFFLGDLRLVLHGPNRMPSHSVCLNLLPFLKNSTNFLKLTHLLNVWNFSVKNIKCVTMYKLFENSLFLLFASLTLVHYSPRLPSVTHTMYVLRTVLRNHNIKMVQLKYSINNKKIHILHMMAKITLPKPMLLIQSTGSGKSCTPSTCTVVNGGIFIKVENTLALSSDQVSKVNLNMTNNIKMVCVHQFEMFKS